MGNGTSGSSMAAFLAERLDERLARRFWIKVNKDGAVPARCPELGPCWVWTAATDPKGYGRFAVMYTTSRSRTFFAHRVALALAGTMPPDDLKACHHCDNPPCVNPAHLFLGTTQDNLSDMTAKGRGRKWVCNRGHEQNAANTRWYFWHGHWLRRCRPCDRIRAPAKKQRAMERQR